MYQLQIYCGGWRDAFHSQAAIRDCAALSSKIVGRLWRVIRVASYVPYATNGVPHIMSLGAVVYGEGAITV